MGKSYSAPTPPDPQTTAAAQTGTNVSTALANAALKNVNQVTPNGNLTYSISGYTPFTDPTTHASYQIPQYTATQTLSPEGQALKSQTDAASLNLGSLANIESGQAKNALSTPFALSNLPQVTAPNLKQVGSGPSLQRIGGGPSLQQIDSGPAFQQFSSGQNLQRIGSGPALQKSLPNAGNITRSYDTGSPDAVANALMARLNPQLDRTRNQLETRLANQGLAPGSQAYNDAIDAATRQENDARLAAILNATQQQATIAGINNQQANFQNAAQQQAFNEGVTSGTFGNAAKQQEYQNQTSAIGQNNAAAQQELQNRTAATSANNSAAQQAFQNRATAAEQHNTALEQQFQNAAAAAGLNNTALQQQFQNEAASTSQNNAAAQQAFQNAQNMRSTALQEQFAARNQPINEITALLSGSQVQNPNFVSTNMPTIPTVDYAGLVNQNYAQKVANAQTQAQMGQSTLGGLFGLGSAFLMGPGYALAKR